MRKNGLETRYGAIYLILKSLSAPTILRDLRTFAKAVLPPVRVLGLALRVVAMKTTDRMSDHRLFQVYFWRCLHFAKNLLLLQALLTPVALIVLQFSVWHPLQGPYRERAVSIRRLSRPFRNTVPPVKPFRRLLFHLNLLELFLVN